MPPRTSAEARDHATFTALMWALSYPGRTQRLPDGGPPLLTIALALVDLETSFFCPDARLADQIARTGARQLPASQALYQLYPAVDGAALESIAAAPTGTLRDPDQSATLALGCAIGAGRLLRLRGPGIPDAVTLRADLPSALLRLRDQARYPLGWDVLLVDGGHVLGLPRTTQIEELD